MIDARFACGRENLDNLSSVAGGPKHEPRRPSALAISEKPPRGVAAANAGSAKS